MAVYKIDPLSDPRWPEFLQRHPDAAIFHTPEWIEALRRTYGYEPVVYTTSSPGSDLTNGIPFCRINSWLTGRRLVSLPFSDHCQQMIARCGREDLSLEEGISSAQIPKFYGLLLMTRRDRWRGRRHHQGRTRAYGSCGSPA